MNDNIPSGAEVERLEAARVGTAPWKKWGPYLSERQWGTVREDYSEAGNAWDSFPHDHARSRIYRWGEDGIAGFSDEKQILCFALALWNGSDPILKERLFGLTNSEGNHGEDVKEYYFYLDCTPTHSYMKYLYKYPQAAYPYLDIVNTNRSRSRDEMEYELLDTGVFNENRYFDVFVEYAKAAPEDTLVRITVHNRGPEEATIHLLPNLWFRNTWYYSSEEPLPKLREASFNSHGSIIAASSPHLGDRYLLCEGASGLLFTENETNSERIFGIANETPYVKDAFHRYLINGETGAVNPQKTGTKAAAQYTLTIPAGGSAVTRLRLTDASPAARAVPFGPVFDSVFEKRIAEADEYYAGITPKSTPPESANVMRQAIAGMLWSKQCYHYDLSRWLQEHGAAPLDASERPVRGREWFHMDNADIISMPDKWEYPWYAAWDLGFHAVTLALADIQFAKDQIELLLNGRYLHPSGQIPAYEWAFGDANPPVHAWATMYIYNMEKSQRGTGDIKFLERVFQKLLLNFTWWVNRKDRFGKNVFEGGFLGLDNIGVFDRSAPLPTGGYLEQADGTAWMALFSQNMLEIAVELALHDNSYEELAIKFADHFAWIAAGINKENGVGLWDEEDGFYYDHLRLPDGSAYPLKIRSIVGLLPLCATTVFEASQREQLPYLMQRINERIKSMPELTRCFHPTGPGHYGVADRGIAALVTRDRLRRLLARALDEEEFLSPYGIRAMSKYHLSHPYVLNAGGQERRVDYQPKESTTGDFGGNSNWRGPIWFPFNMLFLRSLYQFYLYYGDEFQVECPTGSGKWMTLFEVMQDVGKRLTNIFLPDSNGKRPVYGGSEKFQNDPHWKNNILFYEYFHGDNGAGLGASHQTGWTGLVARLIELNQVMTAEGVLKAGRESVYAAVSEKVLQPAA
jgi:hypothetical protein